MNIRKKFAFLLVTLTLSSQALAESRYITDVIYVPMRAGAGNEYRILNRGVKTGTEMTLLQDDAGNGFSKVRIGDQEGFVRSQYLAKETPAMRLLPGVQEKVSKITAENQQLRKELTNRDSQLEELTASLAGTEEQLSEQKTEMRRVQEITADPMAIDRRNKQLIEDNLQLKNQGQVLQAENNQLMRDSSIKWYLYGGGTIFLGILLGLFLPMLRVSKKSSDWV